MADLTCAHCGEPLDGECCPYPDERGHSAPVHRDCEIALLLAEPPPVLTQRDYLHMAIGDVAAALKLTPEGPAHHTLTVTLATLQAVLESRQPARREGP